jgi:hypothetical protein
MIVMIKRVCFEHIYIRFKPLAIQFLKYLFRLNQSIRKFYSFRLGTAAHAYNPNYLGGRDQEDHSWKPIQTSCS